MANIPLEKSTARTAAERRLRVHMEKLLKRVPGMQGRRRSIMQLAVLALVLPASKVAAQADVDEHMPVTLTATSPCTGEVFMG